MAIAYFGRTANPADEGSLGGPDVVLTPPASMLADDYVVVICRYSTTSGALTFSASTTGGQTWEADAQRGNGANTLTQILRCRFNGTWDADPVFTISSGGASNINGVMLVFRGVDAATAIDVAEASANFTAPGNPGPFDITIPEITTQTDGAMVIAFWATKDDNQWAIQTAVWANPSGETQWRNQTGTDSSISAGYLEVASAGGSGAVTNRQTALGGDNGNWHILALRPASGGAVVEGASALTVTADLDSTALVEQQAIAALSATADLDAVAELTIPAVAALSATSDLDATGELTIEGAAAFTAASTLTATGSPTVTGAAALSATGDLDATAHLATAAEAQLSATADLDATAEVAIEGAAALSSTSVLTATASDAGIVTGAASLSVTSDLDAAAIVHEQSAATLTATADLDATASITTEVAASLSAAADLDASASVNPESAAALSASASLAATAEIEVLADAALSSTTTLEATGDVEGTVTGAASLSATTTLTGVGDVTEQASASLEVTADFNATGAVTVFGAAALSSNTTLTAHIPGPTPPTPPTPPPSEGGVGFWRRRRPTLWPLPWETKPPARQPIRAPEPFQEPEVPEPEPVPHIVYGEAHLVTRLPRPARVTPTVIPRIASGAALGARSEMSASGLRWLEDVVIPDDEAVLEALELMDV